MHRGETPVRATLFIHGMVHGMTRGVFGGVRLVMAAAVLTGALTTTPTSAQQWPGDWNNDQQITAADLPGLAQCMTGPGGTLVSGCDAFAFELSGSATMATALAQQPSNNCTASTCTLFPNGGRGYAAYLLPDHFCVAAKAMIRRPSSPVMCGAPGPTPVSNFSCAWVGITERGLPLTFPGALVRWAQLGRTFDRDGTEPGASWKIYTEYVGNATIALTPPQYDIRFFPDEPDLDIELQCDIVPNSGGRVAYRKTTGGLFLVFYQYQHSSWTTTRVNWADFTMETLHVENRVFGQPGAPCVFQNCSYSAGLLSNEIDPDFVSIAAGRLGVVNNSVPSRYVIRPVSTNRFEI